MDIEEMNKKFEEWENSLEGVLYYLKTWGEATVQDTKDKVLIAKTLLKLPREIREKVLNEVIFVFTRACGTVEKVMLVKLVKKEALSHFHREVW
jgi:hypothetical protein